MQRWDIINHLIIKNNYKKYLEIGYYKGWSFDNVKCEYKCAVDPNPCKYPEWEKEQGRGMFIEGSNVIVKSTSDDFFETYKLAGRDEKWDIIFIDGLHEGSQVTKDIENSLKHLSPGGTIILHDCNPPAYEHTTTGVEGCWTGNVYKAAIDFQDSHADWYKFYCVDTDWGVGVIQKGNMEVSWMNLHSVGVLFGKKYSTEWEAFDKNRKELLNLISVEEFLKRNLLYETA